MYVRIHTCITVSLLLKLGYVDVVVALQQLLNCFVLVAAAVCWKKHRNYKLQNYKRKWIETSCSTNFIVLATCAFCWPSAVIIIFHLIYICIYNIQLERWTIYARTHTHTLAASNTHTHNTEKQQSRAAYFVIFKLKENKSNFFCFSKFLNVFHTFHFTLLLFFV